MDQNLSLSNDRRITGIIVQILEVAQAGDMTEDRAEEMYYEIMTHYTNLRIDAADQLVEDIIKIMSLTKH